MIEEKTKWCVIANPKAGTRRFFYIKISVKNRLIQAGLDVDFVFSKYPEHASSLAIAYIEHCFTKFIIVPVVSNVNIAEGKRKGTPKKNPWKPVER